MSERPLFLIVNDDGVHAPGIAALRSAASSFGDVVTVAPMVERSGSGQALTLTEPLRVQEIEPKVYALSGTPTDCTLFAVAELLDRKPDWVLSGINCGSNLGQDTLYSGTVAAAMEALIQGIPAMAFSLRGAKHFKVADFHTATVVASYFIEHRSRLADAAKEHVINVNVPDVPAASLRGVRAAGLGRRLYESRFYKNTDPRGYDYYWLGGGGDEFAPIPGSDCLQVDAGYVSVSFLKPDHNNYDVMDTWRAACQDEFESGFLKVRENS
jgi:5'-nucleotidase